MAESAISTIWRVLHANSVCVGAPWGARAVGCASMARSYDAVSSRAIEGRERRKQEEDEEVDEEKGEGEYHEE